MHCWSQSKFGWLWGFQACSKSCFCSLSSSCFWRPDEEWWGFTWPRVSASTVTSASSHTLKVQAPICSVAQALPPSTRKSQMCSPSHNLSLVWYSCVDFWWGGGASPTTLPWRFSRTRFSSSETFKIWLISPVTLPSADLGAKNPLRRYRGRDWILPNPVLEIRPPQFRVFLGLNPKPNPKP